ncbi:MAG TPA: hypothetical protein HPP83_07530 [Candidatus Hydrogenedentes bacterium]|nr:hypothetical protein [Candidatus Hydrogenedentota bacterium]
MHDSKHFIQELIGRILLIVFAVLSVDKRWWLPIVVAPLFWQLWDLTAGRRSRINHPIFKLIADGITWIVWLAYIAYSIFGFGLNIGHWYGWVLGVVIGLVVAQFLGLLWPYRWHLEGIESTL